MTELNLTISKDDLNKVIVVALERLSQAFRTLLWDYAKQERLSPIQIQFLVYIASHPDKRSFVTEIARDFDLTPATVSDAVKTLDQKGLILKEASPADRRRYFLKLTPRGKKLTRDLSGWKGTIVEQLHQFPLETRQTVMIFLLELLESLKTGEVITEAKTCLSCSYFQRDAQADSDPHLCLLRNVAMNDLDIRIDCPNYKSKK